MRVPGKTFLVGEYGVLLGAEALVFATKPSFEISAASAERHTYLHPDSAAGLYARTVKMEATCALHNPYSVGGFGQSTAEYIFVWSKKNGLSASCLKKIFGDYQRIFEQNGETLSTRPSGADLVAQLMGKVTVFQPELDQVRSLDWPFLKIGFFIVSTGLQVKTHAHLAELERGRLYPLIKKSAAVVDAFKMADPDLFFLVLREWCEKLKEMELQDPEVIKIATALSQIPHVLFVKPNGALGADTVTVFFKLSELQTVRNGLESSSRKMKGLKIMTDHTQLADGVLHGLD